MNVEKLDTISSIEQQMLSRITKKDLNNLKEQGISFFKFIADFCLIGNSKRVNVHKIDNPVCKDLISSSNIEHEYFYCSDVTNEKNITNKSPINLLISYLGPTVNQFTDVIFLDTVYCYTRKEDQILRNRIFKWGKFEILKIPEKVENGDFIRRESLKIYRKIDYSLQHTNQSFLLIYIFDNKLIYRLNQEFYYDEEKIELYPNNIGYKKWIISVGKQIMFFNLETMKVDRILKVSPFVSKDWSIKVIEKNGDLFVNINGMIFFDLDDISKHTIPDCSHIAESFGKKFRILNTIFSLNTKKLSTCILENMAKIDIGVIDSVERIEDAKREMFTIFEEIIEANKLRTLFVPDPKHKQKYARIISSVGCDTDFFHQIVHEEIIKLGDVRYIDSFMVFFFFYHTKDMYFLHVLYCMFFKFKNTIKMFKFANILPINNFDQSVTYKSLKTCINTIFKPKESNKQIKLAKTIAKEILFEEKIHFSDFDFDNKRKKAANLRSQCFIGDSLIEFGWKGKFEYENEEKCEIKSLLHTKLRTFKWQKIKNAGWEQLKNRICRDSELLQQPDKIARLREINNKKMFDQIKNIFIECELEEQKTSKKKSQDSLLFIFLTNNDVPLKILKETIMNENIGENLRIISTVLYCIKERITRNTRILRANQTFSENDFIDESFLESRNLYFPWQNSPDMNISDGFTYLDVENGLVSVLLNGILNISSTSKLSIEKLTRNPLLNRPEEVFYSEIFTRLIFFNRSENYLTLDYLQNLLEMNIKPTKQAEIAFYYQFAGRILFIAIYFLFYHKESNQNLLNSLKKILLRKAKKWEKYAKKDKNFTIVFNYSLITLSLLENVRKKDKLNIKLLRIIRRKIFETKDLRNYTDEETFFVNIHTVQEDDDQFEDDNPDSRLKITGGFSNGPIHFGNTELYKICFGLNLLRNKNLTIKGTLDQSEISDQPKKKTCPPVLTIAYLLLIFYPDWPNCPTELSEFHQMRNLIFLLFEKKQKHYAFRRKKICKSNNFLKYITDLLADFAQNNDEDFSVWPDLISMICDEF